MGRILKAIEYSGISRSGLYELAPKGPGLFRKNGVSTLIDFDVLDSVLDTLLRTPRRPHGYAATREAAMAAFAKSWRRE